MASSDLACSPSQVPADPSRGVPWGYRRTSSGNYAPDPTSWEEAAAFLETLRSYGWRIQPASYRWTEEGKELPYSGGTRIKKWLLHPVLRGGTPRRRRNGATEAEVTWGTHQALIDDSTYRAMCAQMEVNRKMWGSNAERKPQLLTGLCRCALCGERMSYAGGRTHPSVLCKTPDCAARNQSIRESVVNDAMQRTMRARAYELLNELGVDAEVLELKDVINAMERLGDDALAPAIERLRERVAKDYEAAAPDSGFMQDLQDPEFLAEMPPEKLRLLYQETVQAVWIRDRAVERVELSF